MPDAQGYAVVSCHVERPLDDEVWDRYRALIERRPGGFPIASLMRPPAEGEDESLFVVAGARGGRARALRPPHPLDVADARTADRARPRSRGAPRGRLAARAGARAALLLRRRLVHRRRRDRRGRRPRLRRLHRDGLAALVPARRLAAGRARPARLGAARRRPPRARAADDAFARRAREVAARLAAAGRPRPLPRLRAARGGAGARRSPRRSRSSRAAGARSGSTRSRPSGRSPGTPYALPDRDRRRSRRSPGAARARRPQGISVQGRHEPVPDHGAATTERRSSPRTRTRGFATSSPRPATSTRSRRSSRRRATSTRSATTEPGRTATVTVATTATGAEIKVALHPATGIQLVYDAFDTGAGRALPRRRREGRVGRPARPDPADPGRVRVLVAPDPVLRELGAAGGSGSRASGRAGLAFPGSPGGSGCAGRHGLARAASRRSPTAPRSASQGAALDEHLYVGSLAADARRLRGRDRRADRAAAVAARADQVARRRQRARRRCSRTSTASRRRRSRSAGCCSTTRGRRATDSSTFDPSRIPEPRRADPAVHALGVKFMLWVSPRATCADGYPGKPLGRARPPDARPPRPGRGRRVPAAHPRARRARRRRGQGRPRRRERPAAASTSALTNDYPLLYAQAVMGALPKGAAAIFRAATVGSQSVVPGIWAGDQPQEFVGLQRAIVVGADGGDERLPDLGLGRRRLRRPAVRRRRALRPLGAARRRLAGHGGGRRSARTRRRGCSGPAR